MNERETKRRREAFLEVIRRTWSFWPRGPLEEEWGLVQFELVSSGSRNRFEVSDMALGAWARSDPGLSEREARSLWGRGWAQGVEVDERR